MSNFVLKKINFYGAVFDFLKKLTYISLIQSIVRKSKFGRFKFVYRVDYSLKMPNLK